jgi:hypothetical protein
MGFKRAIIPASSAKRLEAPRLEVIGVESLERALGHLVG